MNDRRLGLGLVAVGIVWLVAVETVFPLLFRHSSESLPWLTFVASLNGYGVGIVYLVIGASIGGLALRSRDAPIAFPHTLALVALVLALFVGAGLVREYVRWHTVTGFVPMLGLDWLPAYRFVVGAFARPAELAAYCVAWLFALGRARTLPQRVVCLLGFGLVPGSVAANFVLDGHPATVQAVTAWTVPLYALLYGAPIAVAGYVLGLPPEDRHVRTRTDRTR